MEKIAFLINSLGNSGGTQRVLTNLVNELCENYDITIITSQDAEPFFSLSNKITKIPVFSSTSNSVAALRVRRIVKKFGIKHLIVMDSRSSLYYTCLIPLGVKIILWEHLSLLNGIHGWFQKMSVLYSVIRSNAWITISNVEYIRWVERYPLLKNKIRCIYNIQNKNILKKLKSISSCPNKQYLHKRVLAVGNNWYVKGFDILIKSWKKLSASGWNLTIVGLSQDQIMELRDTFNIESNDNITILAKTNDIDSLYRTSSIFCLTSRSEVLPTVLFEAMAYHLSLVSFPCSGSVKEIVGSDNRHIIISNSVDILSQKLHQLISDRDSFDRNVITCYDGRFDKDTILKQWNKLL